MSAVISKEMKDYVCGYYGKAPGNMDKEIVAKVAGDAEILDPKIAPGTLVRIAHLGAHLRNLGHHLGQTVCGLLHLQLADEVAHHAAGHLVGVHLHVDERGHAALVVTAPGHMDKEIVAKVAGDTEILDPAVAPGTLVTTTYGLSLRAATIISTAGCELPKASGAWAVSATATPASAAFKI